LRAAAAIALEKLEHGCRDAGASTDSSRTKIFFQSVEHRGGESQNSFQTRQSPKPIPRVIRIASDLRVTF
jgi:hypothetical protein